MLPNQPALLDETDRKLYTLLALRELGGKEHRSSDAATSLTGEAK